MATRNTAVGSLTGASYLTAAQYNDAAGGLIGYVKTTTNQTGITTAVDMTALTLTLTPNASRILRIGYGFIVTGSVASEVFNVYILKDGTQIDLAQFAISNIDKRGYCNGFTLDVGPTNASHTYKLQGGASGGSAGTFATSVGATQPGKFFVEDIGPSF